MKTNDGPIGKAFETANADGFQFHVLLSQICFLNLLSLNCAFADPCVKNIIRRGLFHFQLEIFMATLGVNIDHIATLRQQRGTKYPNPIDAAILVQLAGADQITVHLREDRRHIHDTDVRLLKSILQIPLNLEMANTPEMVQFALEIKPNMVTLVPEKREERTTEGGLNLKKFSVQIKETVDHLQKNHIPVSLFIEPNADDIEISAKVNAKMIEIHTGKYAESEGIDADQEFKKIKEACAIAEKLHLIVHAGHGLHYTNTKRIAQIPNMHDLNIGHSIISRAVLVGLERAVKEMKDIIR